MEEVESKIKESEERIMAKIRAIETKTEAAHDSAKRTTKKKLTMI